jgi:DNA polymerase III delta prime subunit
MNDSINNNICDNNTLLNNIKKQYLLEDTNNNEYDNYIRENIIKNLDKLNVHNINLFNKLIILYENYNIPNIIICGNHLTGKKTLLFTFLKLIYKTKKNIDDYILIVNCSFGKGNIRYIREQLKFFASSSINNFENNKIFKSIILLNSDKLTIDAQSSLRRCIEIYNHSTRFFIIVNNKDDLLKPILSRFTCLYCKDSIKENINMEIDKINSKNKNALIKILKSNNDDSINTIDIINLTNKLYNLAFSGDLLIQYIKNNIENNINKYNFLLLIESIKKEIRDEKLIIFVCLNFIYFRYNIDLENILFI